MTALQVTFKGMNASGALRATIEKCAAKLKRCCDPIFSCHVVVDLAEHRHQKGNRYRVHIHLSVPGQNLDVGHRPAQANESHADPYVAVRDAFSAIGRKLQDYAQERRGEIKQHAPLMDPVCRIPDRPIWKGTR